MIATEKKLVLEKSIELDATLASVWDALINPAIIKQYLFNTEAVSDWKEGSPLYFRGEWEGKSYEDKGRIEKMIPNRLFLYKYWSAFSGKPDIAENYANITYVLTPMNGKVRLTITQDNIDSEEIKQHSDQNWGVVLETLKKIVES